MTLSMVSGSLVCDEHAPKDPHVVSHPEVTWCQHVKDAIQSGEDSVFIRSDRTYIIPIFPTHNIYVQVEIGRPIYGNSALMNMSYQPDIGTKRTVPLGLWNPGEGMGSMRTVIMDYLRANIHPDEDLKPDENKMVEPIKTPCPDNGHALPQQTLMKRRSTSLAWKWLCLWNIVMERACTPCIDYANSDDNAKDNFGIGVVDPSPPWARNA
jgi:hypothetical protein